MTTVFVSSEDGGDDIMPLFSLLSHSAGVSAVCRRLANIAANPDFLLLPLESEAVSLQSGCAAVLFQDSPMASALPHDCAVLCFCEGGAARCSGQNRQIISCGLHRKDTVTLSSLESGKPVLSLQRQLTSFSGETIEAGDYPLITPEPNHRALMAAAALLLLGGFPLPPDAFIS